jgi:hypothetical protein
MDMRFGTWNVVSMYRAGSLRVVAEEISKYNVTDLLRALLSNGSVIGPQQRDCFL